MSVERPLPTNIEAEQAVLGACLIDRDVIIRLAPILQPGDFYRHDYRAIYAAILALYQRRIPADLTTVVSELPRHGYPDGMPYSELVDLMNATPTAVHATYYAELVRDAAISRAVIEAGTEIVRIGFDSSLDTDARLSHANAAISAKTTERTTNAYLTMAEAVSLMSDDLDNEKRHQQVVRTGYIDLDHTIGGFKGGQEIIIGARPGVGKSAVAVQIAYQHCIREQRPAGLISLEMSPTAVTERLTALVSGVNMHAYKQMRNDDPRKDELRQRVTDASGVVSNGKLRIVRSINGNLATVLTQARDMHARFGIEALIIDYLQLMRSDKKENRTQEVSEISRSLKVLAMELDIPVIALSQLSRQVEQRGADAHPRLSDLRESGSIEQDADIVIFIHRQLTGGLTVANQDAYFIVAKHRDGPCRSCLMYWQAETARFRDRTQIERSEAAD